MLNWIVKLVVTSLFKNWKTSLVGILGTVISQIPALAPFKEQILAAVVALVAILAKDGDKSNAPQPLPQPAATSTSALTVNPAVPAPEVEIGTGG